MSIDNNKYKRLLLERQEELLTLITNHKEDVAPVKLDQTSVGRLSRMDAMQGQAMAEEVKRRRGQELLRIRSALERITGYDEEYGYCVKCGGSINEERLVFDPSIVLCKKCANRENY
ncbi:MAG: TraR/DksA family transcriptional regulator [Kordiimonadaceae bacterium]|nr:TraR/DksA family transcriptional regulator [Kordiimonadaceae bacterium]